MNSQLIVNGGLGNQMFQYAFALALRHRGHNVMLDTSLYNYAKMHNGYELERVFGIKEPLINKNGFHLRWLRFLLKFKPKMVLSNDPLRYDKSYLINPRRYIFGFWQNEKYFRGIKEHIRNKFVFQNIDEKNLAIAQEICNCNSVSVHIRRGDYLSSNILILTEDYYSRAFKTIIEKVEDPVLYIFSDDRQAAKMIVSKNYSRYIMVDWNKGPNSYKDMYLMSHCKNHIIANSSFSWWGAWLSNNVEGVVVAPQKWTLNQIGLCPQLDSWFLF